MIRREVKSVTVEYNEGDVETFQDEDMYHISREDHPRGATNIDNAYTTHQIRWVGPKES